MNRIRVRRGEHTDGLRRPLRQSVELRVAAPRAGAPVRVALKVLATAALNVGMTRLPMIGTRIPVNTRALSAGGSDSRSEPKLTMIVRTMRNATSHAASAVIVRTTSGCLGTTGPEGRATTDVACSEDRLRGVMTRRIELSARRICDVSRTDYQAARRQSSRYWSSISPHGAKKVRSTRSSFGRVSSTRLRRVFCVPRLHGYGPQQLRRHAHYSTGCR